MSKSNIVDDLEFLKAINAAPDDKEEKKEEVKTSEEELNDLLGLDKPDDKPDHKPDDKPDDKEDLDSNKEKKEEEIQSEEQFSLKRFGVRDTIRSLVENEIWEDVSLKIGDKEYENIEDLLKSEKPTQELFDSLSQAQKQLRDKKLNEEYISIKDKDSTKVKLINAILSDTDYEDLLQYNKEVVQPVTKLDFSNQSDEKVRAYTLGFVRQCLIDIDGIPEKYIDAEIAELESDFRLVEKAEEFQEKVIKNYQDEIDRRTFEKAEIKKQKEELKKVKMKDLKQEFKSQGFNDTFINKALQLGFTEDSDGESHYLKLVKEKSEDPKFKAKLLHFLLDENDFINKVKTPVKKEEVKKTLEIIQILPKEKGGKTTQRNHSNSISEADEEFLEAISKNK